MKYPGLQSRFPRNDTVLAEFIREPQRTARPGPVDYAQESLVEGPVVSKGAPYETLTSVPTSTRSKSSATSAFRMRMQPCEAGLPSLCSSLVPWI